ncbi:MAG: hypothetical protein Q9163_000897, partial [Psora crenata]
MPRLSWTSLLYVTILISVSAAVPVLQPDHSKVYRQPVEGAQKDGIAALRRTFKKYGWTVSQEVASAIAQVNRVHTSEKESTSTANAPASPPAAGDGVAVGRVATTPGHHDSVYLCPATIGGQTLNVNIDTGSSDLWLFNTALSDDDRGTHIIYDPAKSASHKPVADATFNVTYGDRSNLSGHVATDTMTIGGITVADQAIELPTSLSDSIIEDAADGIVGLGFQKLNSICTLSATPPARASRACPKGYVSNPRPTWFENAKTILKDGLFTANLKEGTPGYYNFGEIDHTAFQGDIHYAPVNSSRGHWQFPSRSYKIGDGPTVTYNGHDGIADTGSSILFLDPGVAKAYYTNVQGARNSALGYSFPCTAKLPDFTVALGDYIGTISGDLINYAPIDHSDN